MTSPIPNLTGAWVVTNQRGGLGPVHYLFATLAEAEDWRTRLQSSENDSPPTVNFVPWGAVL